MKEFSRKGNRSLQERETQREMSTQLMALDEESVRRLDEHDSTTGENELPDSESAAIFHKSGDNKIASGDYHGALKDSCEAARLDPENGEHYGLRGVAHYELGHYEEAIRDYSKSIEVCPTPNTLYNRSEAYYKTGRDSEALDDLDHALKLANEMPNYHFVIPEIQKLISIIRDKTISGKDYYQAPIGFGTGSRSAEADQKELDDVGPEVIRFIYSKAMRIDDEWSVTAPRGFTWWGHQLAQRVWAEDCRKDDGVDVTLMHVETDFLRNVENTQQTYEALNDLNAGASQFAFLYDPENRYIGLHSTVYTHRQNLDWSKRIFLETVGLQASYAHMMAGRISHLFVGSEPGTSPHPDNGFRQVKDEMVGLIDNFYIPMSEQEAPIESDTFKFMEEQLQSRFMITTGDSCLTAEFPFTGEEPVCVRLAQGKPGVVTSLLKVNSDEGHPLLRKGLMMRMILPVSYGREQALVYAMSLNLLEATGWVKCHLNGAWYVDERSNLVFVSFCPIAGFQSWWLVNFALSFAIRSKWAAEVLGEGETDHPYRANRMLH